MFTGIIEESGAVRKIERQGNSLRLTIGAKKILTDIKSGDSIAVNGICLTAVDIRLDQFSADVAPETMRRSNLGQIKEHSPVNLERALLLTDRLGGHIVSGHIDGTGILSGKTKEGNALVLRIEVSPALLGYIVEKGSVAVDGISLTVASVDSTGFTVSMIPHTGDITTLGQSRMGEVVNLECDIIGKYVEKLLKSTGSTGLAAEPAAAGRDKLDWDFLRDNGF